MDTKWTQIEKIACDIYIDLFFKTVTNSLDFASDIQFVKSNTIILKL